MDKTKKNPPDRTDATQERERMAKQIHEMLWLLNGNETVLFVVSNDRTTQVFTRGTLNVRTNENQVAVINRDHVDFQTNINNIERIRIGSPVSETTCLHVFIKSPEEILKK